jgi:hypothetical protein
MEKTQQTAMEQPIDEVKQQAELEEYAENGQSAEAIEFAKKEAKLRRKLDLYIAPVMMLLMLISYLDRGNIGFAATQGMADDIGLHGNQLNVSCLHVWKCPSANSNGCRQRFRSSTVLTFLPSFLLRSP